MCCPRNPAIPPMAAGAPSERANSSTSSAYSFVCPVDDSSESRVRETYSSKTIPVIALENRKPRRSAFSGQRRINPNHRSNTRLARRFWRTLPTTAACSETKDYRLASNLLHWGSATALPRVVHNKGRRRQSCQKRTSSLWHQFVGLADVLRAALQESQVISMN